MQKPTIAFNPAECGFATMHDAEAQRAASGLQTIALAADRIRSGASDVILAGGTESMSYVPFGGNKISVNPWLVENYPGSYMSMGLTAERVAAHYGISREAQDQFSYESHQKALKAIENGAFDDEIVPVEVTSAVPDLNAKPGKGKAKPVTATFSKDEGPRADTSLEALARLRDLAQYAKGSRLNCMQLDAFGQDIMRAFDFHGASLFL